MSKKIDIDPSEELNKHGKELFAQYKHEIRDLSHEDISLLLTHMHIATERLMELVKASERKLEISSSTIRKFGL